MAHLYEFIGGPYAGQHSIEGPLPEMRTFARHAAPGEPPIGVAAYRLDQTSGTPCYHFVGMGHQATFREGPLDGRSQLFMSELANPIEFPAHGPTGKVVGTLRYELRETDQSGIAIYGFGGFVDRRTVEDKALEAIYQFYANPDPSVYTSKPQTADVHKQVTIQHGNRSASVDEELAEIIEQCWKHDWETMGSCQERPAEWSKPGLAYIWFPLVEHGRAFAAILEQAGIEHSVKEKEWGIGWRNDQGETTERVKFPAINVYFHRRDFERILAALRTE